MKRTITALALAAVFGTWTYASAHEMHKHEGASGSKAAAATVVGEVVDAGCYLGHAERGADHVDCAKQCIAGGMPMCLLTKEGELYLLTMNHDNADPYTKLKDMAGKTVSVTGMVMSRRGMKAIDVSAMKLVAVRNDARGSKGAKS